MADADLSRLREALESGDARRQVEALLELEGDVDPAVPMLIEALRSPEPTVRSTAAEALGKVGAGASRRFLPETDGRVVPPRGAAPGPRKGSRTPSPRRLRRHVPAEPDAVARGVEAAGTALVGLLDDPEAIVRSDAADALGRLGWRPAIDALITRLRADPDPLVRASAAESLGDLGEARWGGEAGRPTEVKRSRGAAGTVEVRRPEAAESDDQRPRAALRQALEDEDAAVRCYAANALGLVGSGEDLATLRARLELEDALETRTELLGACYRLGARDAVQGLIDMIDGADDSLAINLLNVWQDLATRRRPPGLEQDAPRVIAALDRLAAREPWARGQVDAVAGAMM
jgi:HEAT repeat protein